MVVDNEQREEARFSAYFEYQGERVGAERTKDFFWWGRVMEQQIPRADTFRLECLPRDVEGLDSCARFGAAGFARLRTEGRREVWTGRLNNDFVHEFLVEPFDAGGCIKWNSVLLKGDGKTVLASTSNGGCIGIHGVEEREVKMYANIVRNLRFSYYYWQEGANGQEVDFLPINAFTGDIIDIINAYQRGKKDKP